MLNLKKFLSNKIVLILILASALRLLLLTQVPPSLNWDEVSMGYSAYSIMKTGMDEWGSKLPLFFRSYGEWKSAVYIYVLIPFIKVFGLTALAIRLPSALAGILSVYLTYLIGKKLYSPRAGYWASLFMAVSPWALMLSRPGFEANFALMLILGGVYSFLQYSTKANISYLIVSALLLGLAPHTYNSAKIVVPFLVIFLIITTKLYRTVKHLSIYLVALAVFAAPILVNLFSGVSQARLAQVSVLTDTKELEDFYQSRRAVPGILGKLLYNKVSFSVYKISDNYLDYFSPSFLITSGGTHHQHSLPFHGVLYITELGLAVLGLIVLSKKYSLLSCLPIALILLGFIPAAATRDSGHVLRSILTLPGWQLLAGLGISKLIEDKSKYLTLIKALFVVEAVVFLATYFVVYPRVYARDWQYGHQQVAEYLAQNESAYEQIVMTKWFGEPQLFLAFYNSWDPTWYQAENSKNIKYEEEGRMWLDQLPVYSLGKYSFKYIDWDNEAKDGKTLYIGKFDDFGPEAQILKTVNYPDGTVAFVIAR